MFNQKNQQTPGGREVRRTERVSDVSEDDIKIAVELKAEGKEIPESLRPALAAYEAKQGGTPAPKPVIPNPEDEEEEEEEDGSGGGAGHSSEEKNPDGTPKIPKTPNAAEKKEKKEKKPGDVSGDEDEEEDDEGNKNPVGPKNHSERPIRAMPISKYNAKHEAWKERETELVNELNLTKGKLAEYDKAKTEDNTKKMEQILKDAAEKSGIDEEQLKVIFSTMEEGVIKPLSAKVNELAEALKKANEAKAPTPDEQEKLKWKEQDKKFDQEFDSALTGADADPEMAKHKDAIHELAFTEGYENKSVWEIWTRYVKPKANKKAPGESPNGQPGGGAAGDKDWEEIAKDPAKVRALSIEDAEKFQTYMGSKPRPIRRIR